MKQLNVGHILTFKDFWIFINKKELELTQLEYCC